MHNMTEKLEATIQLRDWLTNLTEDGAMDAIVDAFLQELRPLAEDAARRVVRKHFPAPSLEVLVSRLTPVLCQTRRLLEAMTLDPDLMAIAIDKRQEIFRCANDIGDFLFTLERMHEKEPTVAQSAEVIFQQGGVAP